MGDSTEEKSDNSDIGRTSEDEEKKKPEGGEKDAEAGSVAVESKTVDYVIMNPDFYKEPKKAIRITGPSSAHEYITRKPRG